MYSTRTCVPGGQVMEREEDARWRDERRPEISSPLLKAVLLRSCLREDAIYRNKEAIEEKKTKCVDGVLLEVHIDPD